MDRGKLRGVGSGRDRAEIVAGPVGLTGLRWGWQASRQGRRAAGMAWRAGGQALEARAGVCVWRREQHHPDFQKVLGGTR